PWQAHASAQAASAKFPRGIIRMTRGMVGLRYKRHARIFRACFRPLESVAAALLACRGADACPPREDRETFATLAGSVMFGPRMLRVLSIVIAASNPYFGEAKRLSDELKFAEAIEQLRVARQVPGLSEAEQIEVL